MSRALTENSIGFSQLFSISFEISTLFISFKVSPSLFFNRVIGGFFVEENVVTKYFQLSDG